MLTVTIARVEVQRTLLRAGASIEALGEARRRLLSVKLRAIDDSLLDRAERLEPFELRALDALHLAAALELAAGLDAFVCYDRRLAAAAAFHGLPVVSPGADEVREP